MIERVANWDGSTGCLIREQSHIIELYSLTKCRLMAGIRRSISESTEICQIQDYSVGSIISKGLAACWKEDLLFDFEIVTMERQIVKCHKIVLASVSPFFKAALSPMHLSTEVADKNQIDLPNVTYNAMKNICEFVYTGVVSVMYIAKDVNYE